MFHLIWLRIEGAGGAWGIYPTSWGLTHGLGDQSKILGDQPFFPKDASMAMEWLTKKSKHLLPQKDVHGICQPNFLPNSICLLPCRHLHQPYMAIEGLLRKGGGLTTPTPSAWVFIVIWHGLCYWLE